MLLELLLNGPSLKAVFERDPSLPSSMHRKCSIPGSFCMWELSCQIFHLIPDAASKKAWNLLVSLLQILLAFFVHEDVVFVGRNIQNEISKF